MSANSETAIQDENDIKLRGGNLNHCDDVYLEFSRASAKIRGFGVVLALILLLALAPLLLSSVDLLSAFNGDEWVGIFLLITLIGLLTIVIHQLRSDLVTPRDEPIRFNRKRGIVYICEFKHTWNPFARWNLIFHELPWNTLSAQITKTTGKYTRFDLYLVSVASEAHESSARFLLKYNLDTLKSGKEIWTYCKRYMNIGPEAIPASRIRAKGLSLRRSFFYLVPFLDPTKDGRVAWKEMELVAKVLGVMAAPLYPFAFVIGLGHYIAMRFAPEPTWPSKMDMESTTTPGARPPLPLRSELTPSKIAATETSLLVQNRDLKGNNRGNQQAITTSKWRRDIFGALFALLINSGMLFLVGPLAYKSSKELYISTTTDSWIKTDAILIDKGTKHCYRSGRSGRGYTESIPYVLYAYSIGNTQYQSHRVYWRDYHDPCKDTLIQRSDPLMSRAFPVGSTLYAYVNPKAPMESVLRHELHWGLFSWVGWLLMSLMTLVFASYFLGVILWFLVGCPRLREKTDTTTTPLSTAIDGIWNPDATGGAHNKSALPEDAEGVERKPPV